MGLPHQQGPLFRLSPDMLLSLRSYKVVCTKERNKWRSQLQFIPFGQARFQGYIIRDVALKTSAIIVNSIP